MHPESSLLKFQIGPVQDFIAQARSTRDLWSGSYLLSWLVAAGIREVVRKGAMLIFPNPEGQPLLRLPEVPAGDHRDLLTPNLPNLFIAGVEGDPDEVVKAVRDAIVAEWRAIADSVWNNRSRFGLPDQQKDRFFAQAERHLSLSWCATPMPEGSDATYVEAYRNNGWHLDAVRQSREFSAWSTGHGMLEKDSLSGKEEAVLGGEEFRQQRERQGGEYASLFAKHADYLGAVSVIKRVWHLAYLRDAVTAAKPVLKASSKDFKIRSIPAIAARTVGSDDEDTYEKGDRYIAAIAFDGDEIGRWVSGEFLPCGESLSKHHRQFSACLSDFALNRVRSIIEEETNGRVPLGQLIYAGGDDVVALVPADAALDVAARLRKAFRDATGKTRSTLGQPDASAGIAIAHVRSPLQDLIREAQRAEKRAKAVVGRPAFSVTLMKRSGEISHWGSRWDSQGLALYLAIDEALCSGDLSSKFPHRFCELLSPYLTIRGGLSRQSDAITDGDEAKDLIRREFDHAARRQGEKGVSDRLEPILEACLDGILKVRALKGNASAVSATQELMESLIGLCTSVAFAARNRVAADVIRNNAA
jgi:CRISPR-associated protein Cmr2